MPDSGRLRPCDEVTMLYDLDKEIDRSRFKRRAEQLARERRTVELNDHRRRSLAQNSYLHLILGFFATETGYTLDWVKREYFKRLVNGDLFRTERDGAFGRVEDLRSSRELTPEQMTAAIEKFRNWSSETAGIYIPSPNEEEFLRQIEIELNRQYQYI